MCLMCCSDARRCWQWRSFWSGEIRQYWEIINYYYYSTYQPDKLERGFPKTDATKFVVHNFSKVHQNIRAVFRVLNSQRKSSKSTAYYVFWQMNYMFRSSETIIKLSYKNVRDKCKSVNSFLWDFRLLCHSLQIVL